MKQITTANSNLVKVYICFILSLPKFED